MLWEFLAHKADILKITSNSEWSLMVGNVKYSFLQQSLLAPSVTNKIQSKAGKEARHLGFPKIFSIKLFL